MTSTNLEVVKGLVNSMRLKGYFNYVCVENAIDEENEVVDVYFTKDLNHLGQSSITLASSDIVRFSVMNGIVSLASVNDVQSIDITDKVVFSNAVSDTDFTLSRIDNAYIFGGIGVILAVILFFSVFIHFFKR